jgi:hypothetical protein
MCVLINKAQVFLNELYVIVVLFIILINDNCLLNYLKFELWNYNKLQELEKLKNKRKQKRKVQG